MKRNLAAVVAAVVVVAAIVVVWMSSESDTPRRAPDGTSRVEVAGASGEDTALAAAPSATVPRVGESVAPSDAATRVAATESSTLAGRSFADLVVLREGLAGPLFREYYVLAIAGDGAARRLRSTEVLGARDGDMEGMFVLLLAGACPRFLDPSALVARVDASAAPELIELRVLPSARLVVRTSPAPSGAAPMERVALHASSQTPVPRAWRDVLTAASADYEQFVPEGRAWRRLVDEAATDAERAASLRTIRSSAAFEDVAAEVAPNSYRFLLPWIARAEPASEEVTFDNVPSIAQLTVVFECEDALEHDGVGSSTHRQRQQSGGGALTSLVLERGETRIVNVHHVEHGLVRGVFPVDARAPFGLEIAIFDAGPQGRGGEFLGTWIPPPERGGAFEIQGVVPGRHHFTAAWHDDTGVSRSFRAEIDVAPGAIHDFGTLVDTSGTHELRVRISADPATNATGHDIDFEGLACLVEIASGSGFAGNESGRFVWATHGETVRVDGLRAGHASVEALAVVTRAAAAGDATEFAQRHGLVYRDSGVVDVGSGMLVVGLRRFTVKLPRESVIEFEVTVAAAGSVAVDAFVPAEFVRPNPRTHVVFVNDDGVDVTQRELGAWRGDPSGGGYLSGTFVLPVGEWTAFVRLTLPPTSEEPRHGVALGRVIVESGATRLLALELVRGATLDFAANDVRLVLGTIKNLRLQSLPNCAYALFQGVVVEGRVLYAGLMPDTDYLTADASIARSGPPGSVTVVE